MSSGFNTDVRVGEQVFHVQTEDRGPSHLIIDTAVYQNGRVVHRRSSNYEQFAASPDFSADAIRQRVQEQHRLVIEDVRSGELAGIAPAAAPAIKSGAESEIQIQLLNPKSWLSAGNVLLDVEVLRRTDRQPQAGARVEASIEGAPEGYRHSATSDDQGRVRIQFPLPPLGKGDLALIILASKDSSSDEIRFAMRSKVPPAAPASAC